MAILSFQSPRVIKRFPLLPWISSATWFITLASMLIVWFARGMPRYPGQSNPYVAFISDIAAFNLKPLFLVGVLITVVTYLPTIALIHLLHYEDTRSRLLAIPRQLEAPVTTSQAHRSAVRKSFSLLAFFFAVVAAVSLFSLAIMDTARFHVAHRYLLLSYFVGFGTEAVITTGVLIKGAREKDEQRLRRYTIFRASVVVLEVIFGAVFVGLMYSSYQRVAGILEWVLTFLGTAYLWSHTGLLVIEQNAKSTAEREPLLGTSANP